MQATLIDASCAEMPIKIYSAKKFLLTATTKAINQGMT